MTSDYAGREVSRYSLKSFLPVYARREHRLVSTIYSPGVIAKCSLGLQVHRQGPLLFLSALWLSFGRGTSLNPPMLRTTRLSSLWREEILPVYIRLRKKEERPL